MDEIKNVLIMGHKGSVADAVDIASKYKDRTKYSIRFSFDGHDRQYYSESNFKPYESTHLNAVSLCDILQVVNTNNMITAPMQSAIELAENLDIPIYYLHAKLSEEDLSILNDIKSSLEKACQEEMYEFAPLSEDPSAVQKIVEVYNDQLVRSLEGLIRTNILIDSDKHIIYILDDEVFNNNILCAIPLIFDSVPENSPIKWQLVSEHAITLGHVTFNGKPETKMENGTLKFGITASVTFADPVHISTFELAVEGAHKSGVSVE